ncbi:MAG: LD-carboxypeptidase [Bdellovibrionota bacterium]
MKVIGLWNSGSPVAKEEIAKGLARLDSLGIAAVYPAASRRWASRPESSARKFLAGPDSAKIEALEELVASREIHDILALRGGYGGIRLLPLLDKCGSLLKRYDKTLWGYSDLTVLQHYFFDKCGAAWVHAPMLGSSSFHTPHPVETRWWKKAALGAATHESLNVKALSATVTLKRTEISGPLLGGNLASFVSMMGTPWEPRLPTGTILFFEDINEPTYKLDRLLQQLSGHRDIGNVRALVLGHFTESPQAFGLLKLWSENLEIPAYKGILAGHESPNLPLHLGVRVSLERESSSKCRLVVPTCYLG